MQIPLLLQLLIYCILIAGPVFAIVFLYRAKISREKFEWETGHQYSMLAILVPKNNEKTPLAAEQMFASLHGIFREGKRFQERISFEIISQDNYIQFYVRISHELKDFIKGQIYAQYPTAEIYEVSDYAQATSLNNIKFVGAELNLVKDNFYPIKTFMNFEVDPLSSITSVLSSLENNEKVWIQIIIRPVPDSWQLKGISYATKFRTGKSTSSRSIGSIFISFLKFIFDVISTIGGSEGSGTSKDSGQKVQLSGPVEEAIKAVEQKTTKLGFETKIRILATASDYYTCKSKLEALTGAFKQFNTVNLNGFKAGKLSSTSEFWNHFIERNFDSGGYILNIEELASLYHLPTQTVVTPNIVWAGSKKGEPPSNLPITGTVDPSELTIFAQTDFRDNKQQFGIKKRDRRLHVYTIGKTGTGKSTMLENMIIDDIRQGRGVAVVDPHGELISHVLNFIPAERASDVIYFNPSDHDWPIGFNPLEAVDHDLKNVVASGVVGIFKKIFGEASWGPRLEYILRNAIMALLDYPNATLVSVMRLLTDKDFRKRVLEHVKDPVIRDFFLNEFEKYDPKFRNEAIAPIQNKVGQFLSSPTIRNIVGQPNSSFDIREVMDSSKILLLDLSIGKIGEDNAALLGAMMITKIQLSAMQRANVTEDKRPDFYLYVDEFQNFATESFAVILSEARKYHLNLVLTNQFIAQMPEVVAKAIFGNVGTIVSFRVGATDASFLVKEFEPVFDANDMVNLDNHYIYIKMAIDGVTRPAFSAVTLPPIQGEIGNKDNIIELSRKTYGRKLESVEEIIAQLAVEGRKTEDNKEPDKEFYNKSLEMPIIADDGSLELGIQTVDDQNGAKWYFINKSGIKAKKTDTDEKKESDFIGDKHAKQNSGTDTNKSVIHDADNKPSEKDPVPSKFKSILSSAVERRTKIHHTNEKHAASHSHNSSSSHEKNNTDADDINTLNPGDSIKI